MGLGLGSGLGFGLGFGLGVGVGVGLGVGPNQEEFRQVPRADVARVCCAALIAPEAAKVYVVSHS